ncbi:MAG: thiamine pyrophosphate-dependent dehydrogenase E1 component subunit alpha [Acidimicrobiia bacterium]
MTDRLDLYSTLVAARALEESVSEHAAYYHSGFGMEAVGVGVASGLRPTDPLVTHYRGVAAPLAKGMTAHDILRSFLLKATSPTRARSWHTVDTDRGLYGHQGTSGSEFGRAAGLALAAQRRGEGDVAVAMFGDGSAQRGTLHEAFLMACSWDLPVVWVCENNGYMISTRADRIFPGAIADLAGGYAMPCLTVDGNDVFAVSGAMDELTEAVRSGGPPAFLEAQTFRVRSHTEIEEAPYQDPEEVERWRERDPLAVARGLLIDEGASPEEIDELEAGTRAEIDAATADVLAEPDLDPTANPYEYLYATEAT